MVLALSGNLEAKGERNHVKRVLVPLVVVALQVLEQLVLRRDLVVVLKVVHHLTKVVAQALEVYLTADRAPAEVEVRLLVVQHFSPEVRPRLLHHALDKLGVVAGQDLVLKHAASLCLGQEVVLAERNVAREGRRSTER